MKTVIIAEAGVNHNGNLQIARQLIDVAFDSGADFVKFQTFKAESIATPAAKKAQYQMNHDEFGLSQLEMLRDLEIDESGHRDLIQHAEGKGIKLISTAFDIESVELLKSLGQKLFKIPSGEITNLPYLRNVGMVANEVYLSTGMASLKEIGNALEVLEKAGVSREKITVLQCTSAYPAPASEANLLVIPQMKKDFGVEVGFSDHTLGIEVSLAAVALGASVIEKHFTLDRTMRGPDHKASLEPNELRQMVKLIRTIESSLGDGIKKPSPSELSNRDIVRKSIVARSNISKGEIFSVENLTTKRPGNGLSPMFWDTLIGKTASRSYLKNDLIDEA